MGCMNIVNIQINIYIKIEMMMSYYSLIPALINCTTQYQIKRIKPALFQKGKVRENALGT
jgi:hypothetical protein